MTDNPQTLQAFLEGEAQRWENLAAVLETNHWLAEIVTVYRNHAAHLRTLAAAMADRVVVRAKVQLATEQQNWAIILSEWQLVDKTDDEVAALQAHLTQDGRGWLEEG